LKGFNRSSDSLQIIHFWLLKEYFRSYAFKEIVMSLLMISRGDSQHHTKPFLLLLRGHQRRRMMAPHTTHGESGGRRRAEAAAKHDYDVLSAIGVGLSGGLLLLLRRQQATRDDKTLSPLTAHSPSHLITQLYRFPQSTRSTVKFPAVGDGMTGFPGDAKGSL
jgi:hypothetical protein